ncbi:MAG: NUDIX domain-containing protein [Chitinispirillaceae bacterium]
MYSAPSILKHCPRCSAPFEAKSENHFLCSECGFEYYFNTAAATGAIITDSEGKILLTRRNHEPKKGFLDLPGGFVGFKENAENALRREIKEELNLSLKSTKYLCSIPNTYEFSGLVYHTLDLFFICRPQDFSSLRHNEEIMEVTYLFPQKIDLREIGFSSMKILLDEIRQNPSCLSI